MSLGSRKASETIETIVLILLLFTGEPDWMNEYRQWNSDSGYFAGKEKQAFFLFIK